jgi:hypothetical protein
LLISKKGICTPLKNLRSNPENATKRALSKKDMQLLMNFKPVPNTRKRHSLNYFVFSYLTRGMNLKDMALLKWDVNIVGGRIVYVNEQKQKTPKILKAIIL